MYIAQNGRKYSTGFRVQVDNADIEAAIEYLQIHGRPPTAQAVTELLRSCAHEGLFDLHMSLGYVRPDEENPG